MAVNRIAYIGSDGNVFTIRPDGTDSRRLTTLDLRVGLGGQALAQGSETQSVYAWPTWAPDGSKIAVSRIKSDGVNLTYSLEIVDTGTGISTQLYDNEGNSGRIAASSPHYTYWSPDSNHLAFLASTPRSLASTITLFIGDPEKSENKPRLVGSAPIFFSWSDDGSSLLIHWQGSLLLSSDHDTDVEALQRLGTISSGFRSPAISRDGSKIVYVDEAGTEEALYIANTGPNLAEGRRILDVGPFSAFLWSPTMDELAVADSLDSAVPTFQRLTLVTSDDSSQKSLVNEPLIAFFWSPDGEKIAYVAYDRDQGSFTWKYIHRSGGGPVTLAEFSPSADFLNLIVFFDQYAYSNSVWSPDSSHIVFGGTAGQGAFRRNGSSAGGDSVYVIEVREGSSPRAIAASGLGVWSWR